MAILKFVLEANIGAGKSSFISTIKAQKEKIISEIYEKTKIPIKIYCENEPTQEWEPYLSDYYDTYSNEDFLRLQLIIYSSLFKREKLLSERIKNSKNKNEVAICFLERDMDSGENFFFTHDLPSKDAEILKEFSQILRSNSWIHRHPKTYIFIESDPVSCLTRIHTRQNSFDSQIKLPFLLSLNERYQKFFASTPHFPLSSDENTNIHENPSFIQQFILPIILGGLRSQNYGQQYS